VRTRRSRAGGKVNRRSCEGLDVLLEAAAGSGGLSIPRLDGALEGPTSAPEKTVRHWLPRGTRATSEVVVLVVAAARQRRLARLAGR
jgi:hypothetical protein